MKKSERESRRSGITLIEVIVTLVLVGVISLFAGVAIVSAVEGFISAKDNAETAQKVHLSMNRMARDLLVASNIVSGASQTIVFDTLLVSGVAARQTLTFGNGIVTLNDKTLLDDVTSFEIFYYDGVSGVGSPAYSPGVSRGVEVRLRRGQGVNVQYTDRVFPRNIPQNQGML